MTNFQYPTVLDRIKDFPFETYIRDYIQKEQEQLNLNKSFHVSRLLPLSQNIEKRCYFSKKRNILVEASYKGACRSLDNLFGPLKEWKCINDFGPCDRIKKRQYHQDIFSSHDVEIHTLVRDPISRFASGIRFFARTYPQQYGLMADLETLIKNSHLKYAQHNHFNPQFVGTHLVKGQEEYIQRYLDSVRQNYDRILDDPSEFEEYSMIMEPMESVTLLCFGWHANQHTLNIADLRKSTKYYWVWDLEHHENVRLKQSSDLEDSFFEINHIKFLIENLGLDIDDNHYHGTVKRKTSENTAFSEDTTTYGIVKKYQEHFRLQKSYIPKEYEWIDTLHFENTPDNKPQYVL